ncbi:MAG: CHASE2 domain-containing protein [Cyclobacteriaceae bacterium]
MKKAILLSLGVLFTVLFGLFLYSNYQFRSLNDRFVQLVPGMEERIALIDIGNSDRAAIARKIVEIAACNPRVIGVDLFFKDYDKENFQDSVLLQSIREGKCILGAANKGIGIHNVHRRFREAALNVGYAELNQKKGLVSDFYVYSDSPTRRDYHMAYLMASQYDSLAASAFLASLEGNNPDVVISRLTSQFKIFQPDELLDCGMIRDRMVILGYLGPEDQFRTYTRYRDGIDDDGPDMYGAVIIANQVLMILDKPPTDLPE